MELTFLGDINSLLYYCLISNPFTSFVSVVIIQFKYQDMSEH